MPIVIEKTNEHGFDLGLQHSHFFGVGEPFILRCMLSYLNLQIFLTISLSNLSCSAITCVLIYVPDLTICTFSHVWWDFWHLDLLSSFTFFRSSLNCLWHSNTANFFRATLPYVVLSMPKVSLVLSPNLTQNLILTCCSVIFAADNKTYVCN